VAAVDDEAVGDRPGARQLVREGARAVAVAEEEGGADSAHASHEDAPAADPTPAQLLLKELVLLRAGQRRAPVGPTER
jgi:hypothetical protein